MTATPEFGPAEHDILVNILADHRDREGPLLPILHAVQDAFGHVPQEALPVIAQDLALSKAEVHGVMSFYHDFRAQPAGRTVLKLCRAEACQSVGANDLVAETQKRLGVGLHGTTADGAVTLEEVFCLGLCACGPAAMVNGKLVGRATADKLDALLAEANA